MDKASPMNKSLYGKLIIFAVLQAILVVVLGAYTRLSDAGLGCPDWPGCYGKVLAPLTSDEVERANQAYPDRPVEFVKAVKEMVHRYFAGGLILTVLLLTVLAWKNRKDPDSPTVLATVILALILFQAVLGMWTVTWKLKPVIVMSHLIGGFTTLTLLWLMFLKNGFLQVSGSLQGPSKMYAFSVIGLIILIFQIALGGWTSSNYAALACPDFPTCQTQWWPEMDWKEGFVLWRGIGQDYEFGILDSAARTAIHMTHRIGALVTFAYLATLSMVIIFSSYSKTFKSIAIVIGVLLVVQVLLGISNIVFGLPLAVATAHNAVGALLLLSMVTLVYALFHGSDRNLAKD
jgi:cytochrome c oxidase assembly protein subunit 15